MAGTTPICLLAYLTTDKAKNFERRLWLRMYHLAQIELHNKEELQEIIKLHLDYVEEELDKVQGT